MLQVDVSAPVLEFVSGVESAELSQVGAACPDHLVHTRRLPAWVAFDPDRDDSAVLRERLVEPHARALRRDRQHVDRRISGGCERWVIIRGQGRAGQ